MPSSIPVRQPMRWRAPPTIPFGPVLRPAVAMSLGLLAATLFAGTVSAQSMPDPQRGRMLYETQCNGCHEAHLHMGDAPRAKSWQAVREQVERWAKAGRTAWTEDEYRDVTAWLNEAYYRYPCPEPTCAGSPPHPTASFQPARATVSAEMTMSRFSTKRR